jgi:hypothetical protein
VQEAADAFRVRREDERVSSDDHRWDAGSGWPIFGLPPAELAVHPTEGDTHDELYLTTDDVTPPWELE